jgi:acyl-CoA synthetase (NDP forming)
MMKVGSSVLGSRAARSHTAAVAGDDAVTGAVLAEFGVVRARSTEEMLDFAHLATRRIYPARNTLGVLTISGGAGVLISDAAAALDLPMPPMPAAAQAALTAMLPFAAPANPVDCTGQAFNDTTLVGRFADALADAGGYASVLAFFSQVGGAPSMVPLLRPQLRAAAARHPDRLWVLSVLAPPAVVLDYEADGFTVFEDPGRAVTAIAAMGRLGAAFAAPPGAPPPIVPGVALPAETPDEAAAQALLAEAGIATVPGRVAATPDEAVAAAAALGYPVVLKVLSPDIPHKTEIGGVLTGVAGPDAVRAGFGSLLDRAAAACPTARLHGVLVASHISGGVECLIGVTRDPVFGMVAAFGLGGVFVEALGDVAFRRCPFGEDVAAAMIRSIRGARVLLGARGRPPADIAALARMLARLSVFAHQAGPRLRSIDLNPIFALADGALVADALIEIDPDA